MIKLDSVDKFFILPHEKKSTLRQRFVSIFSKSSYEQFYALQDITLEIKQGEFIGIIGKNGSGKSTLLKLMANVLRPSSGSIEVNGHVAPFLELGVGFQGDLSVNDNIFIYGALLGMTYGETKAKYDWIIEFSGLEKFIDTKLKNLSSGMQAKLGFSITVSIDSPILLIDEVLAVGDIDFQKKCYEIFENFHRQGKTIIFVSHNLSAVEQFCSKTILLSNGKIIASGSTSQILEKYQSQR